jgi:di/tricarboxylate transporter
MIVVLCVLLLTVYLFTSEIIRVDIASILILVLLGLLTLFPGLENLVQTKDLFSGFSSNAVVSIMGVMVIGASLDRSGIMSKVAQFILRYGGKTDRSVVSLISSSVAIISSFMQNVGAAALFIPVVSRISNRTKIPVSRLLMPMGFCAILGGTITMVGSSPLILLNDLIITLNQSIPPDQKMATFGLFSVTPVGIALVTAGIIYFLFAGKYILPNADEDDDASNFQDKVISSYNLDPAIHAIRLPNSSELIGREIHDIEYEDDIHIVARQTFGKNELSPDRDDKLVSPTTIAIMGTEESVKAFSEKYGLRLGPGEELFPELASETSGISEIVIPAGSNLIGQTIATTKIRKKFGLTALAIHRGDMVHTEGLQNIPLESGDTMLAFSSWDSYAHLRRDRNFIPVTMNYPKDTTRASKANYAIFFFVIAICLILFSDFPLSLSLWVGAIGMIITGVLTAEEAYLSISWKTVFLLACLIPLGRAVATTNTAAWIAQQILAFMGDVPSWVLQACIAVIATLATLVMSNVGATVLLVPLAVKIAISSGADPAMFALTVAISTSNSFILPTHQVNALIMGPGGYRVSDFMRAGGLMTLIFLIVELLALNLFF